MGFFFAFDGSLVMQEPETYDFLVGVLWFIVVAVAGKQVSGSLFPPSSTMIPQRSLMVAAFFCLLPSLEAFLSNPTRSLQHPIQSSTTTRIRSTTASHSLLGRRPTRSRLYGILDDDEEDYQRRKKAREEQERLEELDEIGPVVPPYQLQAQFSIFDDLWPYMVSIYENLTTLDRPGTRRRSAQTTILSVAVISLFSVVSFLVLIPFGFVHRADTTTYAQVGGNNQQQQVANTRTQSNMMVVGKRTFVDPDKILQEDFVRGGDAGEVVCSGGGNSCY